MRFSTAKFTEIAKTSILIILILNFFIIFFEIKYIEYIYLIIFFIFNFLVKIIEIKNYKNIYEKLKEMLKAKRNFFVAVNILIFFYIFKEPYFFLFKHKILILLGSVIIGYFSLIFIQKIKIKLSLNFFKEIVKIFLISAIIYYLPILSVQLGKFFYIF
ncbi:hypothetical protein [Fusobacterium periodonticum]|jgi:hypothetical protein|uniref:Uncharacterized protein n=3 Tax=Fusobacterium periodonticum TaxID=860 RepID=K1HH96_9FUSO|nr:hypothetical protein [Fusobacterium periodonticum]AVQ26132.1 hypothetical protein C4N17_11135 [Fusobacterium periodonticum]EKA94733.1 hypothetical protein FPOG_00904 [Fusobacterium periodonticum D10]KGE62268.1 hypothetical protein FSAG_000905 [Fusobacterium periodonticum 2_1_31]